MNKSIDEVIKEKFTDSKYNIPASYEKRVDKTIKEIEEIIVEDSRKHILYKANRKVAGVAIIVLMLSVVSVSSYAAVNMFQQRMHSKSEKKVEGEYDRDVREDQGDAVTYSGKKLKKQSLAIVAALYDLNENDLKVVSTNLEDESYEFVVRADNIEFSVYYSNENVVERVICTNSNLPAHESGRKLKDLKPELISEKLKKRAEVFSGKEITSQSGYSLINKKGKLAYGTVSYYYQMADGSGCVAVYSTAYHDMYDIYKMDNAKMMKEIIEEKSKKAEENGYTYQRI